MELHPTDESPKLTDHDKNSRGIPNGFRKGPPVSDPTDRSERSETASVAIFPVETPGMMPVDRIPFRRWFPWIRLTQAISLALSVRQLVIAMLAVGALWLGHIGVERLLPESRVATSFTVTLGSDRNFATIPRLPWPPSQISELAQPWKEIVAPAYFALLPNQNWSLRLRLKAHLICSLFIWTLFGLALCRQAGRRFSCEEQGSLRRSLKFGATRWWRGIVAPLIPAAAATLLALGALLLILPGRMPVVGTPFLVLVSPIIVLLCFAAAWLLIAIALGWPLMIAAVSVDDCDGFGGLSRSYSMWTGRPWYYAWCVIVSAFVGVIATALAGAIGLVTISLIRLVSLQALSASSTVQWLMHLVHFIIALLFQAYCVSFFWTCATISYLMLRQSVDSMPLEIIAPDERPVREPFPVAGIPAVEPRT